jgi:hypothetical protein
MAMKPEVKAAWVKALRSGDYKQGRSVLRRNDDTYCCLGVLCELAVKAGAIAPGVLDQGAYVYGNGPDHGDSYGQSTMFLPCQVEEWSGIIDRKGHDEDVINDLIGYNDEGKDFAFIASVIEARL